MGVTEIYDTGCKVLSEKSACTCEYGYRHAAKFMTDGMQYWTPCCQGEIHIMGY